MLVFVVFFYVIVCLFFKKSFFHSKNMHFLLFRKHTCVGKSTSREGGCFDPVG